MLTSPSMEKQSMKASKPAMEKRRRARINESLLQLKALVLDGLNKNNSRHSKLEKADILEMTVRYLRNVQRQQVKTCVNSDAMDLSQYRSGFTECMGEVSRCGAMDDSPDVRARLIGHLAGLCTTQQQQQLPQPTRYSVVAHGQMQPALRALPTQPSPAPVMTSSAPPRGVVAMNSATAAISIRPPVQMSFPTPPLSSVGCQAVRPAMTSPPFEGARTVCVPSALRLQEPSPKITTEDVSEAPPTPHIESPVSRGKQAVMIAQNLPPPAADMITLILPSQSLPGGQVPTHLIPVYAQEASKDVSPPLGFRSHSRIDSAATLAGPANNGTACTVAASSPKAASTVPTISPGQPAAWTAIQVPTAKLVSPQAGTVSPQFTFTIPYNSKLPTPGLVVQAKQPAELVGPRVRFPALLPNFEASADSDDPMWRPW